MPLGELVPTGGGDSIPLLQSKIMIGRRGNCDIVLPYPNVSSEHCQLELMNGYWQIRDLGSRNGVKVNGERCETRWLHPGDAISIAKNHFEIRYEPLGEAPPEEENAFEMSLLEKAGLEKKRAEQRRLTLPPAAKKIQSSQRQDADEDAAMDWLLGD